MGVLVNAVDDWGGLGRVERKKVRSPKVREKGIGE